MNNTGSIPTLFARGSTLPEAWEKAICALWEKGVEVRTEYDRKNSEGKFIDPPSRDATRTAKIGISSTIDLRTTEGQIKGPG